MCVCVCERVDRFFFCIEGDFFLFTCVRLLVIMLKGPVVPAPPEHGRPVEYVEHEKEDGKEAEEHEVRVGVSVRPPARPARRRRRRPPLLPRLGALRRAVGPGGGGPDLLELELEKYHSVLEEGPEDEDDAGNHPALDGRQPFGLRANLDDDQSWALSVFLDFFNNKNRFFAFFLSSYVI